MIDTAEATTPTYSMETVEELCALDALFYEIRPHVRGLVLLLDEAGNADTGEYPERLRDVENAANDLERRFREAQQRHPRLDVANESAEYCRTTARLAALAQEEPDLYGLDSAMSECADRVWKHFASGDPASFTSCAEGVVGRWEVEVDHV